MTLSLVNKVKQFKNVPKISIFHSDKSEEETNIVSEDDIEDVLEVKQSEVIESK